MRIGVFDSGVGGITVLRELRRRLDWAEFVYLGDTANLPYGTKSPAQVKTVCLAAAHLMQNERIDALVVACNTASSLALPEIVELMRPVPVFGMVEAGVAAVGDWLVRQTSPESRSVLILATTATVRSQAYTEGVQAWCQTQSAFRDCLPVILQQACPLLAPMIEEGWMTHPILQATVREYVQPHLEKQSPGIVLLGCTHYPWIHRVVAEAMPGWHVLDSSWAVGERLEHHTLFQKPSRPLPLAGSTRWIFTDPQAVPQFVQDYL